MFALSKPITIAVLCLAGVLVLGATIIAVRWDAKNDVKIEIKAESLETDLDNLEEKIESDREIHNVDADDLVDFGCKWLHKTDPNYCE